MGGGYPRVMEPGKRHRKNLTPGYPESSKARGPGLGEMDCNRSHGF